MKQFNTSPQSQAHCLVARADAQPKPAKELALQTHGQTGIKHETLTHNIENGGESSDLKHSSPHQIL